MGLDMYLHRMPKVKGYSFNELIELDSLLFGENVLTEQQKKDLAPYIQKRESFFKYESIKEEVAYWRKANQIHSWFVQYVQGGEDECRAHEVTKDHVIALLDTCKNVLASCNLIEGEVINGYIYENGERIPFTEKGKVIEDSFLAELLLPTTSGFFFGSTQYNEYYVNDIQLTIEQLEKVLTETDFDTHYLVYRSSW